MRFHYTDELSKIDVSFDFTSDPGNYWDGFWDRRRGLGIGSNDPDTVSKKLRDHHRILWSRELPNGETMILKREPGKYLQWNGMSFGSDSITASFRYVRRKEFISTLYEALPRMGFPDYRTYMEDYIHRGYTIGGSIIFPKHRTSMNSERGCLRTICDRWDLTLECIKRHYEGERTPLDKAFALDEWFFRKFVDFQGYVDYFFLNDCIDRNGDVIFWYNRSLNTVNNMPSTVEDYVEWIRLNLDFVEKRNRRIEEAIRSSVSEISTVE